MSSKFQSFISSREKQEFKTTNSKFQDVLDRYAFLEISSKNESELNLEISQNIKESKVIVIGHYEEQEEKKR